MSASGSREPDAAVRIPIALALLVREDSVLLAHRHPARPWYPDCWDLIGGHVEPGESPAQAVVRECREELGITISNPRPIDLSTSDPLLAIHAYLVTDWDREPVNAAPDEHDDLRWFRPQDLDGLVLSDPAVRPAILRALARVA